MKKRILAAVMAATVFFSTVGAGIHVKAETASDNSGTTYYVSTLHGKDSNNGTSEDTPFYSLHKMNDIELKPGDKILLESGSVFKNDYLHLYGQSGSKEAPIVISKYGSGSAPVIDTNGQGVWFQNYGYRLDNTWHKYQGYVSSSILLYDSEYIEISDLEIVNNNPKVDTVYNAADMMDRTGVAAVAQDKGTIDHIYLKNLNIHDIIGNVYNKHMNNGGIYFTVFMPHDAQLRVKSGQENQSTANKRRDFISSATGVPRYDDVLIEGCSVTNTNRWGIAVGYTALWDKFADTAAIDDDVINEYGSTNVVIRNNYVKDAGGDSITLMYCDRPLVEYNISDGAARQMHMKDYLPSVDQGQRFAAAIWPWKCKDAVFQYNEAFDTRNTNGENGDGQAWDADWGDGTVYQYNYSHNNGGGCLMVCLQEAYRTTFRYNISQNDLMGALCIFGSPEAHIYNNVFYMKEGVPVNRANKSGSPALLENNIFYFSGEEPGTDDSWNQGNNKTYSNNLYYNYAEGTTPTDAAGVVVAKGAPVFENPGTAPALTTGSINLHNAAGVRSVFDGYKLAENSRAIGAGKVVTDKFGKAVEKDFFGNSLEGVTAIDIGAYQHQEEGTETVPSSPSKPSIGEVTETSAVISWPAVWDIVGIKGYKITDEDGKVILDLTGEKLTEATDDAQMVSTELKDLEPGKTYTFSITAYDVNNKESEAQQFVITTLQKEDPVITDIKNQLDGIDVLNKGDYTEESWIAMEKVYDQLADLISSRNPDINQCRKLLEQLEALKNNLKTPLIQKAEQELAAKIAAADAQYNAGQRNYTKESWDAFTAAYNAAKNPPQGATADKLNELAKALEFALLGLKEADVNADDSLKNNDTYTDTKNKIVYRVVSAEKLTAAVKAGNNKKAKNVKIPNTVTIKGKTCKVVQIDNNAFKNYSRMTNLTIGKNVNKIGKNAFTGSKKLKKVTIQSKVLKTIQKNAFKNSKKNVKVKWPSGMKKKALNTLKRNLKKQGLKFK